MDRLPPLVKTRSPTDHLHGSAESAVISLTSVLSSELCMSARTPRRATVMPTGARMTLDRPRRPLSRGGDDAVEVRVTGTARSRRSK
jgi:hypothetical protein